MLYQTELHPGPRAAVRTARARPASLLAAANENAPEKNAQQKRAQGEAPSAFLNNDLHPYG